MSLLPKDLAWLRDMAQRSGERVEREDVQTLIRLTAHGYVTIDQSRRTWHLTADGREAVREMEARR